MKRILLLFFLASITFFSKLNAQSCTITNVSIAPTSVDAETCTVTFDLSYTLTVNDGSKYAIVHLWQGSHSSPGAYPVATSSTASMIGTIVVKSPNVKKETPSLLFAWPSDIKTGTTPSTPILTGSFSYSENANGSRTFSFKGLQVKVTSCAAQVAITGDVWATQNGQNASCLNANTINVIANDPVMRGLLFCTNPRSFNVSFTTLASQTITFSIYKDANGNTVFDDEDRANGKLTLSGGGLASPTTDVTVNNPANALTTYGNYIYNQQPIGSTFGIFVVARVAGNTYDNVLFIENTCSSPLPVSFKSFNATRSSSATSLKWTTSTEINNKGFYVQRYYNGQWENVVFIATKAEGGNSSADLNYSYDDGFNFKGVAQYRILQVDMDGKAKYSMVRSVSNGSQAGSISVYPNPAPSNTNVSIVLGDATATYDIQIVDNSGRIVKEFAAVKNTQQVSNLPKGQYLARVKQRDNNQVSVEKFIVQ